MGTRSFPAGDGALVYSPSGAGGALLARAGVYATIYTDKAATTVATGLTYPDGSPVVDGRLLVDATSRLPRFLDPAGRLVLYSKPDGSSVVTTLYADSEEFIATADGRYPARRAGTTTVAASQVVVNVKDFGAVGDGTADDTSAISAAITAAGQGGRIVLPPGRYKTGPLSLLPWQTLEGDVQQFGGGSSVPVELLFPGLTAAQVGIVGSDSTTIRDVRLAGPGATVGTCIGFHSSGATCRLEGVTFYRWNTGVRLTNNYYSTLDGCEFRFNTTSLLLDYCYNINLYACRLNNAIDGGTTYGTGINCIGNANVFTLHGCAVENYDVGINLNSGSMVSLFGTYFETLHVGATGVNVQSLTGTVVNAYGCQVYLNNHNAWINLSALTDGTLNSRGNRFICPSSGTAAPTAYFWGATALFDADVSGDNWQSVTFTGALYRRDLPPTARISTEDPLLATGTYIGKHRQFGRSIGVPPGSVVQTGRAATASRPDPAVAGAGAMFYDTSLGKPIWSNGSSWRDATNTIV